MVRVLTLFLDYEVEECEYFRLLESWDQVGQTKKEAEFHSCLGQRSRILRGISRKIVKELLDIPPDINNPFSGFVFRYRLKLVNSKIKMLKAQEQSTKLGI